MITFCADCVYCNKGVKHCNKLDIDVNLDIDGCLVGSRNLPDKCDICNRYVNGKCVLVQDQEFGQTNQNDIWYGLCGGCAEKLGECPTCREAQFCLFETSSSTLPKIIQKQIQNGPMTQIMQVRNPDRVAETCAKGCKCYDGEGCMREYGRCNQYKLICSQ